MSSVDSSTGRFVRHAGAWLGALVVLAFVYQNIGVFSPRYPPTVGRQISALLNFVGVLAPFCAFAGGVALVGKMNATRSVLIGGLLCGTVSWVAGSWAGPWVTGLAEAEVMAERPQTFQPATPVNLLRQRAYILENPPTRYSLSVERPLSQPPNHLAFLVARDLATVAFAVLNALLGYMIGMATAAQPPPMRRQARWGGGLAAAIAFAAAAIAGGAWVRSSLAVSGVMAAGMALVAPILALILLRSIVVRRQPDLHARRPASVS